MNAPTTRGTAIAAHCRQCIHDPAAFGTWREQTAICPTTDCALWRFRPLQDKASSPSWIWSRNPADLPDGWQRMPQADAVRCMRQWIAGNAAAHAVQPDDTASDPDDLRSPSGADDEPEPDGGSRP